MLCPSCGTSNAETELFCHECGGDLTTSQPAPASIGGTTPVPHEVLGADRSKAATTLGAINQSQLSSSAQENSGEGAQYFSATQVLNHGNIAPQRTLHRRNVGKLIAVALGCLLLVVASFFTARFFWPKKSKSAVLENGRPAVDYSRLAFVRTLKIRGPEDLSAIRSLHFSPDGQSLVVEGWEQMSADSGGKTILWNTQSGMRTDLDGSEGYIFALEFAKDGRTMAEARGYSFGTLKLWDWHTGRLINNLTPETDAYDNSVRHVALTTDGRIVAASGNGQYGEPAQYRVQVWDLRTGNTIRIFNYYQSGNALAFAPDNSVLAYALGSEVKLWDTRNWNEKTALSAGYEDINDMAFSPDGRLLATLSNDGVMRLWDTKTWKVQRILAGHKGKPYSFSFSPDGKSLLSVSSIMQDGETISSEIKLWDVETGEARLTISSNTRLEYAISPDSRILASASSVIREEEVPDRSPDEEVLSSEVKLWDISTGKLLRAMDKNTGLRYAAEVGFSPDGQTFVTAGWKKTTMINEGARTKYIGEELQFWDVETGEIRREMTGERVFAFSQDGQMLATGNDDGEAKLWRVETSTH